MSTTISIDPVTRIEGHLAVHLDIQDGKVRTARCSGEMFRGFEQILRGRHPLDAQQITQRICGVCPIAHGMASILAQDEAYGITPPKNGWLIRNLIQGANYIQSHILHFYHLSALDFVDIAAITKYRGANPTLNELKAWVTAQLGSKAVFPAAPFLPRYNGGYVKDVDLNITAVQHYLEALDMRRIMHEAAALWCGKMPHAATLVPGGVTEKVTPVQIAAYKSRIQLVQKFIQFAYIPDVVAVAKAFPEYFRAGKGCGNFLSYGVFMESDDKRKRLLPSGVIRNGQLEPFNSDKIREHIEHSYFSSPSGLHPYDGKTAPAPDRRGEAYSWLKAPRYDGLAMEVGPLARVMVAYHQDCLPQLKKAVNDLLAMFKASPDALNSVLGRHAARAIECKLIADRCAQWVQMLEPDKPTGVDFQIPKTAKGAGLWEAPRGAIGHWLVIKNHKIENYQCIVPTTWNGSPRDNAGTPGPIEQALVGTEVKDPENPLAAARVIRSFDPCIACAVH